MIAAMSVRDTSAVSSAVSNGTQSLSRESAYEAAWEKIESAVTDMKDYKMIIGSSTVTAKIVGDDPRDSRFVIVDVKGSGNKDYEGRSVVDKETFVQSTRDMFRDIIYPHSNEEKAAITVSAINNSTRTAGRAKGRTRHK